MWLVYDNTQWAVSLGGGICLWVCEKTTEIRLNKQAPGRPESGNGGVCGLCTTTQWAVSLLGWYMSLVLRKNN